LAASTTAIWQSILFKKSPNFSVTPNITSLVKVDRLTQTINSIEQKKKVK